jgi:hypothetical protein
MSSNASRAARGKRAATSSEPSDPLPPIPISLERLAEDLRTIDTGPRLIDGWARNRCQWAATIISALAKSEPSQ